MSDRIGVVVDGQLVGTIPAFPNGIGDMLKSAFFAEHKQKIWAETRQGEVVLIRAESQDIAGRIPGFDSSSGKPARSLRQLLLSFFGLGRSSLM